MQEIIGHIVGEGAFIAMPLIILAWIGIMIWLNLAGQTAGNTFSERLSNRLLFNASVGFAVFLGLVVVFGVITAIVGLLIGIFSK
jgi:hypothetical protein